MKNALAIAIAALFLSGNAAVAAEPQVERQQSMKSVGQAMGTLAKTAKGEIDYDATAVIEAFAAMNTAAVNFIDQFPEGTETGHETEASPNIWSDRAGFEEAVKKFDTDTANAVIAAPHDIAAFRAEFGKVAQNCKTCHETYRVSKK
ncbi:cytochrome c [Nitratireductor sp. XY-223]|uniref:c-type cytochrome n=1 Tax=Nitratireductor sp. XY-223 TaxID=2561926 RepID=UPI0010AA8746|nr:cytochrome c [Nitratireductor sp. XY-223]